jgi:hypothetical protein
MSEVVSRLQLPSEYRAERDHLFPSPSSFDWFVRRNRTELIAAGALLIPTGRWMVEPAAFDEAIMTIGARRAQQS